MKTHSAIVFLAMVSFIPLRAQANQTGAPQPNSAGQCPPPAVVAAFLGFPDTEAVQFGELLNQFQTSLRGLQEQIAARQTQLDALLSQQNPDPAMVGGLVVQINAVQKQIAQVIRGYQTQFSSLLTDEQKQKVQVLTQASQLQPVAGAFVALNLVPAPMPLPCQKQ